jgi:hypothetical protein
MRLSLGSASYQRSSERMDTVETYLAELRSVRYCGSAVGITHSCTRLRIRGWEAPAQQSAAKIRVALRSKIGRLTSANVQVFSRRQRQSHHALRRPEAENLHISGLMQRSKYSSFDHLMPLPLRSLTVHLQNDASLGVQ